MTNCPQCDKELVLRNIGYVVSLFRYDQAKCVNGHSSVRCVDDGKVGWFHNAVIVGGRYPAFQYLDDDLAPAEEFERFLRQANPPKEEILPDKVARLKEKFVVFKFGGGPLPDNWAAGWWTGPDDDLICVRPDIKDWWESHKLLSPVCRHPVLAIIAFLLKRWLAAIDSNLKKTWKGNRTYEEYGSDDIDFR